MNNYFKSSSYFIFINILIFVLPTGLISQNMNLSRHNLGYGMPTELEKDKNSGTPNYSQQPKIQNTLGILDSVIFFSKDNIFDGYKYKREYTYENNENLIIELGLKWDPSIAQWINDWRNTHGYDNNGNRLNWLLEKWNLNEELWENVQRSAYTFNVNGNPTSYLFEHWDISTSQWVWEYRGRYNYDEDGTFLTSIFEYWDSYTESWINDRKYSATYDTSSKPISYLREKWDISVEQWFNDQKCTIVYDDSGNITTRLYENWNPDITQWMKYYRYTYTYDDRGNMLTLLNDNWDKDGEKWTHYILQTYTYNDFDNVVHFISKSWNVNEWISGVSTCYIMDFSYFCEELFAYYTINTIIQNKRNLTHLKYSLLQNYPNPFNPNTTIEFSLPKNEYITLTIYNNLGKKIKILLNEEMAPGSHIINFDGSDLPSGLYFYRIVAGSFVSTKKLLLLK